MAERSEPPHISGERIGRERERKRSDTGAWV
jgi:hypothetical protein